MTSEYIEERFYFTYITDQYAIANRHRIGVDRLMWSSDFPHSGSDWPNSWRTIDANFADVPRAERITVSLVAPCRWPGLLRGTAERRRNPRSGKGPVCSSTGRTPRRRPGTRTCGHRERQWRSRPAPAALRA